VLTQAVLWCWVLHYCFVMMCIGSWTITVVLQGKGTVQAVSETVLLTQAGDKMPALVSVCDPSPFTPLPFTRNSSPPEAAWSAGVSWHHLLFDTDMNASHSHTHSAGPYHSHPSPAQPITPPCPPPLPFTPLPFTAACRPRPPPEAAWP
jgi:hypothetical protein